MVTKQLRRSRNDKVLGGVCGGIGEYFDIDPIIIRILWIVVALFAGTGLLIYLILWILIPMEEEDKAEFREVNDNPET